MCNGTFTSAVKAVGGGTEAKGGRKRWLVVVDCVAGKLTELRWRFRGSSVCLWRHHICVAEPWTRVAGELNARFQQISIRDFTSQGCLGGPIGCLDTVQLEITRGNLSQQITLSAARTEIQRDQGVNRTKVFDHEITSVTLKINT